VLLTSRCFFFPARNGYIQFCVTMYHPSLSGSIVYRDTLTDLHSLFCLVMLLAEGWGRGGAQEYRVASILVHILAGLLSVQLNRGQFATSTPNHEATPGALRYYY
jgi:hypothetical protein